MTMYAVNMDTWSTAPMIGWNTRPPTAEECRFVGRDEDENDCVVETDCGPEAQAHLARTFELFGTCDVAHVIPDGIYLEE